MDAQTMISRRGLVTGGTLAAAALVLAGCTPQAAGPTAAPATTRPAVDALVALEQESGVTIGLAAGAGRTPALVYRADQRFPMCSLFKTLVVAELLRSHAYDDGFWSQAVAFGAGDVVENSPVTGRNTTGSMSVSELADAALRHSDNTAGNLLLQLLGGPGALTGALPRLGAAHTRLDRWEPELNEALPGDERDTTTPNDVFLLYGDALQGRSLDRLGTARLQDWMLRNTTSGERLRAAVPPGVELADKTGAGAYGVVNDAGVAWDGERAVTVAVLTRTDDATAVNRNDVVRQASEIAWKAIAG